MTLRPDIEVSCRFVTKITLRDLYCSTQGERILGAVGTGSSGVKLTRTTRYPKRTASAQSDSRYMGATCCIIPHPPFSSGHCSQVEANSCRARGSKGTASMVSVISPHPSAISSRSRSPKPRCFCSCSCDLPGRVPLMSSKECNKDAQTLENAGNPPAPKVPRLFF